jgi:arylsulfatase A-like enzyme
MKHIHFRVRLACFVLGLIYATVATAAERKQPNILYIMSDDHAATAIGAYNMRLAKYAPTPNIDRIAREGMRLDNVFCNNSICTPSRASIITGQYSHINGIFTLNGSLTPQSESFPRRLQQVGYQTAVIGKWHIKSDPDGFDHYEVLPGQGAYFNPSFKRDGKKTRYQGYCTDIITDLSLDWLKGRDKNKPFLLLCQHKAPHGWWEYAPRHKNLYANVTLPEPANIHDDFANRSNAFKVHHRTLLWHADRMANGSRGREWPTGKLDIVGLNTKQISKAAYQKYVKDYLRCVKAVDEGVGRLMKYLDDEGLTDDTIIIYTSDQGMFLGEHGYIDKRLILEESLRMPFLIRYPGHINPGSSNDSIIVNVDFSETLLDFAGAEIPKTMQGRSFRPLLEGKQIPGWRKSMFYAYWGGPSQHYGVRTKRYKLVIHHTGERDLFDLKTDPTEMHSEIENPKYIAIRKRLENELTRLMQEVRISKQTLPGNRKQNRKQNRKKKSR